MEELSKTEFLKFQKPKRKIDWKIFGIIFIFLISFALGIFGGFISTSYLLKKYLKEIKIPKEKVVEREVVQKEIPKTESSQEKTIVQVVKEVSPAVVSIVITKQVPVYETPFEWFFETPKGYEKREIGGGSGFLISEDGLILTNNHVVSEKDADYTVFLLDGRSFPAKILATDRRRDIAIIKIEGEKFPKVKFGDSDKLEIGQTVIAIGNALGEFRNTVSVGVISGLGRSITASGGGVVETLEDVIQTDAAINQGNSGGPLLNLNGEVIGINTAMVVGAENIGFAIPINKAKKDLEQFQKTGKISFPYLGIWYFNLNEDLAKEVKKKLGKDLPNQGAWITRWTRDEYGNWYKRREPAIVPGSAAERAGLKEDDVILEFGGQKITPQNSLAKIIEKYAPGDRVSLKVQRENKEIFLEAILGEMPGS
jgi:S1-C subfamily serine protease